MTPYLALSGEHQPALGSPHPLSKRWLFLSRGALDTPSRCWVTLGKSLLLSEPPFPHLLNGDLVSCLCCSSTQECYVQSQGPMKVRCHHPFGSAIGFPPKPHGPLWDWDYVTGRKGGGVACLKGCSVARPAAGKVGFGWDPSLRHFRQGCGTSWAPVAGAAGPDSWPREVPAQRRGRQNSCPIPGPQRDCRRSPADSLCDTSFSS